MRPLRDSCGGGHGAVANTVRCPKSLTMLLSRSTISSQRSTMGLTVSSNLALSCFHCNSFKGSNIGGRDLLTHKFSRLFNPRRHKWNRHFHWEGAYLRGRTAVGRVTINVLNINDPLRVELRQELIEEGIFQA